MVVKKMEKVEGLPAHIHQTAAAGERALGHTVMISRAQIVTRSTSKVKCNYSNSAEFASPDYTEVGILGLTLRQPESVTS